MMIIVLFAHRCSCPSQESDSRKGRGRSGGTAWIEVTWSSRPHLQDGILGLQHFLIEPGGKFLPVKCF